MLEDYHKSVRKPERVETHRIFVEILLVDYVESSQLVHCEETSLSYHENAAGDGVNTD